MKKKKGSIWSADSIFGRFVNFMALPVHEAMVCSKWPWKCKGAALDLTGYAPVFEDTFEKLDESVWQAHGEGLRKGGYWDRGQARIEDGCLKIRTEYKENGPCGPGYYSWGAQTTQAFERTYGYFEARCILPGAQGLWSAFWLTRGGVRRGVPGTRAAELDVMESPLWKRHGREGLISQNIHYNGYSAGHRMRNVAVVKAVRPYERFNTYGVKWTPEEYVFYVNGRETGRSRFGGVCGEPLYMLLSVEVDGVGGVPRAGWSGKITKNKAGAMPAEFVVDSVRVWERDG